MALANAVNATSTGLQSLTSLGVFNGCTITGTANQVAIANGDGTTGNPTVSLTSNIYVSGISFNSGTNVLSNYSTGTFTPTLLNTVSAPTVSYSTQFGSYSYIGNRVLCNFNVILSAYTAGSGNIQIGSLPFTSNNTSNNNNFGAINIGTVTFGVGVSYYVCNLAPNVTSTDISGIVTASGNTNLAASGGANTSAFAGNLSYEV